MVKGGKKVIVKWQKVAVTQSGHYTAKKWQKSGNLCQNAHYIFSPVRSAVRVLMKYSSYLQNMVINVPETIEYSDFAESTP